MKTRLEDYLPPGAVSKVPVLSGALPGAVRSIPIFAILLAAVCLLFLSSCALSVRPAAVTSGEIPVRFVYTDAGAKQVCLAGSFNDWSGRSHCLTRSGDAWSLEVFLPVGRYQYVYVIDGEIWREDPGAAISEDSGFGSRNSILIVE